MENALRKVVCERRKTVNDNMLDALAVISFLVGVANYGENLTQSDKDDLIKSLNEQTNQIVERVETSLNYQNRMLEKILEILMEE